LDAGAKVAGRIVADMTFLKTKGLLKEYISDSGPKMPYYKVEFDLVMIIQGRDLTYEARWPKRKKNDDSEDVREVEENTFDRFGPPQARCNGQISIAAAFEPGTM